MAEVIFDYDSLCINIQCNINDKMKDIINKFRAKIEKKEQSILYYLYNGRTINEELTFNEQANDYDKSRKKMNILVTSDEENNSKNKRIVSNDVICPECNENILINIKDFKINLSECKNKHTINNILLNKFEETQKLDLTKIICEICNKNNKGNTHNNEFYICNTCNKNICPLCKSIHDKKHKTINYDNKNYMCIKHNEPFFKYCKTCDENICFVCENKHINHNIFEFELSNIFIEKEDLLKMKEDLKNIIDKFKWKIKIIKEIFDQMINILDIYYKINDYIMENYNFNKRNYHNLKNLNNLKNNNEKLIKDLQNIINNDNISEIYEFSFNNFYNINGEKYIGIIKNGLKEGKGIIYYNRDDEKERKKYEGDFKNDLKEGKGIMYWIDGDRYDGDWKNDKNEGKGIYYYKNGDRYEGDFKNGKAEGKGTHYFINGDRYEGDWKNDLKEGKGIEFYNEDDENERKKYEGNFKNGLREGKGIIYWRDGTRYEGNWKNDETVGKGIMYFNDGEIKEVILEKGKYTRK